MKLLALDASTAVAGAALMEDGRLVCETNLMSFRRHSELLMPIVDGCMKWAGWEPKDLNAVAAVAGPGSYTGIRIGVAAAKGIAGALGIPVVSVNTLEVIAAGFVGFAGVTAALLDARGGRAYCAAYMGEDVLIEPAAMAVSEFLSHSVIAQAGAVLFAGDGAEACRDMIEQALGSKAQHAPQHLIHPRAGAAAYVSWRRALRGETMEAGALEPIYLSKPQAERLREAGNGA